MQALEGHPIAVVHPNAWFTGLGGGMDGGTAIARKVEEQPSGWCCALRQSIELSFEGGRGDLGILQDRHALWRDAHGRSDLPGIGDIGAGCTQRANLAIGVGRDAQDEGLPINGR